MVCQWVDIGRCTYTMYRYYVIYTLVWSDLFVEWIYINWNWYNFIRKIKSTIINYRKTIVRQLHQLSVGLVYHFQFHPKFQYLLRDHILYFFQEKKTNDYFSLYVNKIKILRKYHRERLPIINNWTDSKSVAIVCAPPCWVITGANITSTSLKPRHVHAL